MEDALIQVINKVMRMDETTKGERRQRLKDRALVNAYVSGGRRQPRRAHCSDAQMALNILVPHQVFNLSNAVPVKTFHFFTLFSCRVCYCPIGQTSHMITPRLTNKEPSRGIKSWGHSVTGYPRRNYVSCFHISVGPQKSP